MHVAGESVISIAVTLTVKYQKCRGKLEPHAIMSSTQQNILVEIGATPRSLEIDPIPT